MPSAYRHPGKHAGLTGQHHDAYEEQDSTPLLRPLRALLCTRRFRPMIGRGG